MIVGSHYVFIAVPRTASISIASWLIHHQQGVWGGEHHSTNIPPNYRTGKMRFAVVRNPYTRLPSLYRFTKQQFWSNPTWRKSAEAGLWQRDGMPFDSDMRTFIDWCTTQKDHKWCSQSKMLSSVRMDKILHFEELPYCLLKIPCFHSLEGFSHLNRSEEEEIHWTPELVYSIRRHSGEDFKNYGYDIDAKNILSGPGTEVYPELL